MSGDPPSPAPDDRLARLSRDLREAFGAWNASESSGSGWDHGHFETLARRAFRIQYEGNRPYRRFCDRRGRDPASVSDWREIPAVPTAGFRAVPLVVGDPDEAVLEFRTSGTTGRLDRRGRHLVRDPALYRASLEAAFRAFVLSRIGGSGRPAMLSLVPSFRDAPHSSLSWMIDAVMERFSAEGGIHAATAEGIEWGEATRAARRAAADGGPLCVLATTLAVAEWTDRLADRGERLELSTDSVLMDTGGAKGRPGLDRTEVVRAVGERLGLPATRVVNEFGMTELLSQRYTRRGPPDEVSTGEGSTADDLAWLHGPPWLRTRALDPETLEELPEGETGVLCHFDLANAASVCAVLTEDLGRVGGGRLRYEGRAGGSPPRGCSLATADLLASRPTFDDTDWSVG